MHLRPFTDLIFPYFTMRLPGLSTKERRRYCFFHAAVIQ